MHMWTDWTWAWVAFTWYSGLWHPCSSTYTPLAKGMFSQARLTKLRHGGLWCKGIPYTPLATVMLTEARCWNTRTCKQALFITSSYLPMGMWSKCLLVHRPFFIPLIMIHWGALVGRPLHHPWQLTLNPTQERRKTIYCNQGVWRNAMQCCTNVNGAVVVY